MQTHIYLPLKLNVGFLPHGYLGEIELVRPYCPQTKPNN